MTRRVVGGYLVLAVALLLILELPLAILYGRRERDALAAATQRDATTLAALSEESIEHPQAHDLQALADRYSTDNEGGALIVDADGRFLTKGDTDDPGFAEALASARAGHVAVGTNSESAYVAVPVGSGAQHGAVLVSRDTASTVRRIHQLWTALSVIALAAIAVAVIAGLRLANWVAEPLRRLEEHAAALGRGDLGERARAVGGPEEVQLLQSTFNDMAARLEEVVSSQGRFVADASHQLRTPLTALRLRLENLAESNGQHANVEAALAEVDRLSRLVDGLLALARAEGARPRRELVDIDAVIANRFDTWLPLAEETGVELRYAAPASPGLSAMLVPGALDQILDNLIDNALAASTAGQKVELVRRRDGRDIAIHVVDEGRGMTAIEREHAFDRFWRGGTRAEGTGLGLAIVDQLARATGATVTLDASPAGGIDAAVRMPAA